MVFGGAVLAPAQDPQEPSPRPAATGSAASGPSVSDEPEAGRVLGLIPDNKIVSSQNAATEEPLTIREKFALASKDTIDPFTFVLAGFYAGVAQWQNDYPAWRQGAQGYGKRFGAAYADQAIGNFFTEGIVPALAHEDPRYFRKGMGSAWSRIGYAMSRTVVTRSDNGGSQFNYSEIAGNAASAGMSNLYYPAADRTWGETGEKFAIQVASDSAFNVLLEFWPDMRRAVLKHAPFKH